MGKVYSANSNQKNIAMAILVSDKVDFRVQNISRVKKIS